MDEESERGSVPEVVSLEVGQDKLEPSFLVGTVWPRNLVPNQFLMSSIRRIVDLFLM